MRSDIRRLPVLFSTLLLFAIPAAADEAPADVAPAAQGPAAAEPAWRPPAPSPTSKDWVRMSSGEWLRGTMEQIHDGDVKFDSDDLDDLELDWKEIVEVRSPHRHTYRFEGRKIVTGTMRMKDGVIQIDTGTRVETWKRGQLVAMQEGEPKEINFWSFKAGLGFIARSGNTDQTDLSASFSITRRTALTRFMMDYEGAFSSVNGDETANSHRFVTGFDVYLTRNLFLQVPVVELYRDPFVNIDLRATPGLGIGYDVLSNKWVTWEVGGGAGYQYTKFVSVQPGEASDSNDIALVASTGVDVDITKDIDWDTDFKLAAVPTDLDQSNMHLSSVISVELWGPLDLDTTFNWDWVNKPRETAGGAIPSSSDLRISVGLGLDF